MGEKLAQPDRVLCVDLDGTLVRTDLLHETLFSFLKLNPFGIFLVLPWLLKGRAVLKKELAARTEINPATLPYNIALLDELVKQQRSGRKLVLATSADSKLAEGVAKHVGVFGEVVASDGQRNLGGFEKLALLREKFGEEGFDYVGDARVDLPIWGAAGEAWMVSSNPGLIKRVKALGKPVKIFAGRRGVFRPLLRALRPHQWVKNFLIFLAPLLAQRILEPQIFFATLVGFVAFCLCSSSAYLINDLFDLAADREHHVKKMRPLACGDLSLAWGAFIVVPLISIAFILALLLPAKFIFALALYFVATLTYSLVLKQEPILDIVTLASLYSLRILAGGYAAQILVSTWLLAFSMFLFLSLACVKRFSEIYRLREANHQKVKGRGYVTGDMELVAQFGTAAGYISVLVLALYMNSEEVARYYTHPRELWLICPLLLYWIGRIWLLAHRGQVLEDPIVFAMKDKVSYLVGALSGLILLFAI